MTTQTTSSIAGLQQAQQTLREVLLGELGAELAAEAGSLDRMLTHLVNMNAAVEKMPEVHANVAKRLRDFATTASRMAMRNAAVAPQLVQLSDELSAASQQLRECKAAASPAADDAAG